MQNLNRQQAKNEGCLEDYCHLEFIGPQELYPGLKASHREVTKHHRDIIALEKMHAHRWLDILKSFPNKARIKYKDKTYWEWWSDNLDKEKRNREKEIKKIISYYQSRLINED